MRNDTKVMIEPLSCAFCSGKGTGQFGIMSRLSDYQACFGKGVVQVQVPFVTCAHCQGSGVVKRLSRTVCRGKQGSRRNWANHHLPELPRYR